MYINIVELLEWIKEACGKQAGCEDCPLSKEYGDPARHYCSIYDRPDRWQIDSTQDPEVLFDVTDIEKRYIMEVEK